MSKEGSVLCPGIVILEHPLNQKATWTITALRTQNQPLERPLSEEGDLPRPGNIILDRPPIEKVTGTPVESPGALRPATVAITMTMAVIMTMAVLMTVAVIGTTLETGQEITPKARWGN